MTHYTIYLFKVFWRSVDWLRLRYQKDDAYLLVRVRRLVCKKLFKSTVWTMNLFELKDIISICKCTGQAFGIEVDLCRILSILCTSQSTAINSSSLLE